VDNNAMKLQERLAEDILKGRVGTPATLSMPCQVYSLLDVEAVGDRHNSQSHGSEN
jgi:hypothetical protein